MKKLLILTALLASVIMANAQDSVIVKCDSVVKLYGQSAVLSGIENGNRIYYLYHWRGGWSPPPLLNETFVIYPGGKRIRNRFVYCRKK